jgi:hypothetical protein
LDGHTPVAGRLAAAFDANIWPLGIVCSVGMPLPDVLVNVKRLDATITSASDGGLRIGAGARLTDLVEHAGAGKLYPALIHAALEVNHRLRPESNIDQQS